MAEAFICDAIRTPFGRYAGALSSVRTDDLAALPIAGLARRNPKVDWSALDDVIYGCANQAGEDNRNVARMALLLAGLPVDVPAATVNRLCGSGMEAIGQLARAIRAGESSIGIAGGVESMSRAPFVMPKAEGPFARTNAIYDTTIGWRFVNPRMKGLHGIDQMPETAENVAAEYKVTRAAQDAFALRSQQRALAAQASGALAEEIVAVTLPARKGESIVVAKDEHPRETSLEQLARLKPIVREDGTVTAGNASGVNDGAVAMLLATREAGEKAGVKPIARVIASAAAGVPPQIMGIGPVAASKKALARAGLTLKDMDVIEINEAFAAQVLACLKGLGVSFDDKRVNPNGGAIAVGHPLGASGTRLALTAARQLQRTGGRYALVSLCIGGGQGMAAILERA